MVLIQTRAYQLNKSKILLINLKAAKVYSPMMAAVLMKLSQEMILKKSLQAPRVNTVNF